MSAVVTSQGVVWVTDTAARTASVIATIVVESGVAPTPPAATVQVVVMG